MAKSCTLSNLCGKQAPKLMKKALEDPVLAPFVHVQIKDSNDAVVAQAAGLSSIYGNNSIDIRVGNTYPAVVKSLQIGNSRGAGGTVEILDQEGGDFKTIFSKLTKLGSVSDCMCWVRWGWVSSKCNGVLSPISGGDAGDPTKQPQVGQATPFLKYLIKGISVDYSAGTIKYTLNLIDQIENLVDTLIPGVVGTDIFLVDAIEKVCKEKGLETKWVMFTAAGAEVPFRFRVDAGNIDPVKGMRGRFAGDNRKVLECFTEWIRPVVADVGPTGKGIRVFMDPSFGKNGTIVFAPQIAPVGKELVDPTPVTVAAYSVNSGGCSPVISFKPQIAVLGTTAFTSGGTGGGATTPGAQPANGPGGGLTEKDAAKRGVSELSPQLYNLNSNLMRVGYNVAMTLLRDERLGRMRRAITTAYNNMFLNNLANLPWQAITAELKVQGDPTFCRPLFYNGFFVNLTVINPFQIGNNINFIGPRLPVPVPCKWETSDKPCNEILSNAGWVIEGVSHDIHDGSYTTTFKLKLPNPGTDISIYSALGGVTK